MNVFRSTISICLLAAGAVQAGSLAGYDFDANASNYLEATAVAAHVTAGQLSSPMDISSYDNGGDTSGLDADGEAFGDSGTLGSVAIQIYDAITASFADAVVGDDYLTFTVTPDDRYRINLSSLTFKASKQAAISVDEYAVTDASGNLIGSPFSITATVGLTGTFDGLSVDLSDSRFQNLTKATTFRIYAWGRGADSGSGSLALLDKVVLNGSAELAIVVGYDFDAGTSNAAIVANGVTASPLSSPMAVSFDAAIGDNSGVDAWNSDFGDAGTLGAVGIQVTAATQTTFEDAVEDDDYIAFTISPDSGRGIQLSSFAFKAAKQDVNSVDEYALADASGNLIGSTVTIPTIDNNLIGTYGEVRDELADTALEVITETTELRLYAWGRGSNNASGTLAAVDKITLYGSSFTLGEDYYVSTTGNDSNDGTEGAPFGTIQHAAQQAEAGSTIYIRGGTYHEDIDLAGITGLPGLPITLTPYGDEKVTLDGTQPITTAWRLDELDSIVLPVGNDTPTNNIPGIGNVYVTTLDENIDDITQLFVDSEIMTLARFPNALVWSDDFWEQRTQKQSGSERGYIVGEAEIAEAGVSFTDCVMLFNFENYGSAVSYVTSHMAGTNVFEYSHRGGWRHSSAYFFEGGKDNAERVMLDRTQEWAFDESTRNLYLWADDGQNPAGREIMGKVQEYAITGDATTKHIVIDGLDFFATTWGFDFSDGITIRNCNNDYPSCSDRALGGSGQPKTPYIHGSSDDWCEDVTLYNNIFRRADGAALITAYTENMLVENNLFEKVNYTCLAGKAVQLAGSRYLVARRNTLRDSGTSAGFSIGRWWSDDGVYPYVFEYNVAEGCSRMQIDGTAYYAVGGNAQEAIARYNWAFDNRQRDFRWDGNNSPVVTGLFCNLYRNVCMNSVDKTSNLIGGAYKLKGDFHEIYNNIAVDVDGREKGQFEISIGAGGNASSESFNNAGDYLSGNSTDGDIPGTTGNNFQAQREPRAMSLLLRDASDFDFRPRWDAVELIDQAIEVTCTYNNGEVVDVTAGYNGDAPDIGAYEFGDDNYWIPGYQTPQASSPIPSDGNAKAQYDCDLIWLGGLGAVSYDIYLGAASNTLAFAGSQTNNIFNPGGWPNDQTYFWRIDSVLPDSSVVTGEVWTFTLNDHAPRAFSSRHSVMEDQSLAFGLTGYDPDGNSLSHSVTTQPANGTLTGTAPNLVYTPNPDFNKTDHIQFTVNNGTSGSTTGIVIFDVEDDEADAPYFNLNPFTKTTAFVGVAYSNSIADAASDLDGHVLNYSVVSGPTWLNVSTNGELSGTPSLSDFGINSWVIEATDPKGLSATATLEIRVIEEEIVELNFEDLGTDVITNSLMVAGSSNNLTVVGIEDGNDYLYSVVYTDTDIDGDAVNDTLTFDVRVKGWSGGTTDAALDEDGSTHAASAVIGTTVEDVVLTGSKFTIGDSKIGNGQSLEFLLENLTLSLTDAGMYGIATPAGFNAARLQQTSNTGNSHQGIFGEGSGLLGIQFATAVESTLDVGRGPLYISSDEGGGTRSTSWGVEHVGFGIEVELAAYGSYTEWAATYGLTDILASTDSDEDGLSNLAEYLNGTDPLVPNTIRPGDVARMAYTFETVGNIEGTTSGTFYTAPDLNTFGPGVTVSSLELSDGESGDDPALHYGRIVDAGGGSVEAAVGDRGDPNTIEFSLSISDTVTVSLTNITFDTSYFTPANVSGGVDVNWTFQTIVGAVTNTISSGTYNHDNDPDYQSLLATDIDLEGLSRLSDTMVTFRWTLDGVGRSHNFETRHMGLDDVILTGVNEGAAAVTDFAAEVISGGTEMALSWMTVSGESYGVMATTNLVDGPWFEITNGVSGNDAPVSVTNALTEQQRFYRVYLEE